MSRSLKIMRVLSFKYCEVTSVESRRVRNTLADRRLGLKYGPGDGDKVDMIGRRGGSPS